MADGFLGGVGETALGAAMLRAEESARSDRLFDDPYAAAFVAAAPDIFADGPDPGDPEIERLRLAFTDQLAIRTRFYDDYVLAATRAGCTQIVLLGAGLDTRAFRLDWPESVRVFELDLPQVFEFKRAVLDAHGAVATCDRVAVGVDLADAWVGDLLDAGFDPRAVTAWTAEGLLSYLTDGQVEALLMNVSGSSSARSRFAAEAARLEDDSTLIEAATLSSLAPITSMWRGGLRDDPGAWLEAQSWSVERHDRVQLAKRYGRLIDDASTGGFLVAQRVAGSFDRRQVRGMERLLAVSTRMHDDEVDVDEPLVRELLTAQMPHLADRSLTKVEPWGTDHAIWRLGDDLVVRLPRIGWAAGQPDHEAEWLPRLAPHVPVAIPEPIAVGEPGGGYPFRWAVHRWITGDGAAIERVADPIALALDLAAVVRGLRNAPTDGAPPPSNRARPLAEYDAATRWGIDRASHLIDADAATAVWDDALAAAEYDGRAVWVQGDLEGNCLVSEGRLCGIVDWGSSCVGDPAVDVQVVWSPLFSEETRGVFLDALDVDDAMLRRSRGAAINQACMALPYYLDTYPLIVERSWHKLEAVGVPRRTSP